ncbi:MAG TPA: hypothetical protein VH054_22005, partial [Polyangiaceae bacterium]|nr:hypothetical protein [Polyangiaceae bacterium]
MPIGGMAPRPTPRAVRIALARIDRSPLPLLELLDLEWELLQWADYWRRRGRLAVIEGGRN